MTSIDLITVGVLAIVSGAGLLLMVAGYDLTDVVLGPIGWVSGGVAGSAIGWIGLSSAGTQPVADSELLVITGLLVIVGALCGAILIRVLARFAAGFAGFSAGFLATLIGVLGDQIRPVVNEFFRPGLLAAPGERLREIVVILDAMGEIVMQAIGVAALVGIITGVLAMRNYDVLMAVCLTAIGAGLIAITAPGWIDLIRGDAAAVAYEETLSVRVTVALFVGGLLSQYARHRTGDQRPAALE